ncbi:Tc toxin subunit A-related protein [Luteibacter yeojuensis]
MPSKPASSLVYTLIDASAIESSSSAKVEDFPKAMRGLGYESVFDIIRDQRDVFARKLVVAWAGADARLASKAYDHAVCLAAQASLVYRQRRLSKGSIPTVGRRTGLRSLTDVGPGYAKQFKEDWGNFCRAGALEALDSPVMYLVDILRYARALEANGDQSKITLEQRRPDLFVGTGASAGGLVIDRSSTFDPLPVLQIANEVVETQIQRYLDRSTGDASATTIEEHFVSQRYPFLFPYEQGYEQVQWGLGTTLGELSYRGSPGRTPFSPISHDTSGASEGFVAAAWSGLSRERQHVLLNPPAASTLDEVIAYCRNYYGLDVSDIGATELQRVGSFLAQAGLTGDALDELLACGPNTPVASANCGEVASATAARHGAVYVNGNEDTTTPLLIHWPAASATDKAPTLKDASIQHFIRMGDMARLRQWTGISFADLDVLVQMAHRHGGASGAATITPDTVKLLGAYRYFGKKYGIRADEFSALFSDMSPYSTAGTRNLFDRTFNHPPLLDAAFTLDNTPFTEAIADQSGQPAETMLQLCAGLGLRPDENEYGRIAAYAKAVQPDGELKRSLPVVSAFYRLARGATMFGLKPREYLDLLELLGGMPAGRGMASGQRRAVAPVTPTNVFVPAGSMIAARVGHTATLLEDGRVLVAGGRGGVATCEIYDPKSDKWTAAKDMHYGRYRHSAVRLENGAVLVLGGRSTDPDDAITAELYDPSSDTWSVVAPMPRAFKRMPMVALPGNRVLYLGEFEPAGVSPDYPSNGAIFDLASNTWKKTPFQDNWPSGYTLTDLQDGSVMIAGGLDKDGRPLDEVASYDDFARPHFSKITTLPTATIGHSATVVDGSFYFAGGHGEAGGDRNEVGYIDAPLEPWKKVASMHFARSQHFAIALQNGKLLVLGGNHSSAECYDPSMGAWLDTAFTLEPRMDFTATLLRDNSVLVVGGTTNGVQLKSTERYIPDESVAGSSLDILMRVDWAVDWLKSKRKTVADLGAIANPDEADVENSSAIEEMTRRIHQGIPATLVTSEVIASLGLPASGDVAEIPWDTILLHLFDGDGLVAEPAITLGTPPETVLMQSIADVLAPYEFAGKADAVIGLTDVIGSAWRAQCGLLEAELSHDSGLSPESVVLALAWSGSSVRDMLAPLLAAEEPSAAWLTRLGSFKRHARALTETGLGAVALNTFVARPSWFNPLSKMTLSARTLYLMYRYREWLNSIAGSGRGTEDDVIRYLAVANDKPSGESSNDFTTRCAALLAPLLGWNAGDVLAAGASTSSGGPFLRFSDIEWLLRLDALSASSGVPIPVVLQLGKLDNASTASHWSSAGSAVVSAVKAGDVDSSELDARIGEARRDALVNLYLAEVAKNDATLPSIVRSLKTPDDLYEYLLLDTQVTRSVKTSRVASAIASVQQYVNGILLGMEPGYREWQPEPGEGENWKLTEWRDQKSQYPIWAANQQLRYFPELYINPSLRLGKSRYFEELEQEINQNRIHVDTVQQAVLTYLAKFEEVANLTIINGYATSDEFADATYYFVGKSRGENKYYWRSVDMSQRSKPVGSDHKVDTLNPSAWSDWKQIDLPVSEATVERTIRPVFFNERLFVIWVDWYPAGLPSGEAAGSDPSAPKPTLRVNGIYKKYDDSWSPPNTYIEKVLTKAQLDGASGEESLNQSSFDSYAFYDRHAKPRSLFVGVYAGFIKGPDVDGSKDACRLMWNARVDAHFGIEPFWPSSGEFASDATHGGVRDENAAEMNYVRVVCRQFCAVGMNHDRIQFAVSPPGTRIKTLKAVSPPSWNYGGHQASLEYKYDLTINHGASGRHTLELRCSLNHDVNFINRHSRLNLLLEHGEMTLIFDRSHVSISTGTFSEGSELVLLPGFYNPPSPDLTVIATFQFAHTFEDSYDPKSVYFWPDLTAPSLPLTIPFGGRKFNAVFDDNRRDAYVTYRNPGGTSSIQRRELIEDFAIADAEKINSRYVIGYAKNGVALPAPLSGEIKRGTEAALLPVGTDWSATIEIDRESLLPITGDSSWKPIGNGKLFQLAFGIEGIGVESHSLAGYNCMYLDIELENYVADKKSPKLSTLLHPELGVAEFIDFTGSSIEFSDGKPAQKRSPIRMNTLFTQELISRANVALESLLDWETQGLPEPILPNQTPPSVMDFKGANGKYFWELFFHLPFSIAHRFHDEQQFADSDRWLQFIFDPNYKGLPVGEDLDVSQRRPYWMVRPLDRVNDPKPELSYALRGPIDPDGQASTFPVHYRKAVYFLFIRNLLLRGDWAYRELTPDGLNEAKLWYVRALDLLGPRPDVMLSDRWTPVSVGQIVASKNEALRELAEIMGRGDEKGLPALQLQSFERDAFLTSDDMAEAFFRVPFNRKLVGLWDQLESRLYNLRHNRTIDGKPLLLPIFAPPLDPSVLLARFAQGGTSRSGNRLGLTTVPHYRYQTVYSRASGAVESLIQFGQALLSMVERKEQAELSELQQSQLWEISAFAITLQEQMQAVEDANEQALLATRRIMEGRRDYYEGRLQDGGVSAEEVSAAALHMTARSMEGGAAAVDLAGHIMRAIPNVFGLANGGQQVSGPVEGVGRSIIGAASVVHGVAESLDRAAQYKRRSEEWTLQRDQAVLDLAQLDEQLNVLNEQRKTTTTQLRQARMALAHAEVLHAFLSKRFSGSAMYGWLVSQMSTFYYQAYDTTLSMCMAAEACWQFEIGDFTARFIEPGRWKDAYRGLTVGEGLKLNLLKMDAAYLDRHERLLVIGKTVSVKALYEAAAEDGAPSKWEADRAKGVLEFKLSQALLDADYSGYTLRRIRRIGVSIPAVVGAYQDIRAVLTQTRNLFVDQNGEPREGLRASQQIVVSRGIDDDGMMAEPQDDRYLPFEGTGVDSDWTLEFSDPADTQASLLGSLNDVILHVTYTARPAAGGAAAPRRLPRGRGTP